VQDEDRPLVGIDAAEPAFEFTSIGETQARVGFRGLEDPCVDLDIPSPLRMSFLAIAGSDEQTMDPGIEAIGIA